MTKMDKNGDWSIENLSRLLSEEDYREIMKLIDSLMDAEAGTKEGADLDMYATLAELYEKRRWPMTYESEKLPLRGQLGLSSAASECPCDSEKTVDPICAAAGECAREVKESIT